jgi:hypothetical protein
MVFPGMYHVSSWLTAYERAYMIRSERVKEMVTRGWL